MRSKLPKLPVKSVVRLGSTTDLSDTVTNGGKRIEINTIEAIKNSANKLLMKQCFDKLAVKTAKWQTLNDFLKEPKIEAPYVVKHIFGSRGRGNHLFQDLEQIKKFVFNRDVSKYIIEEYKNFSREYRLHITKNGCFYTCRKMLRADVPKEQRWVRNDSTSNWILEENELFDKPINWQDIIAESVKALNSVGLHIGAVDLRVQSTKDKKERTRENPDYFVIEINSAASFGNVTAEKYLEMLPKLIMDEARNLNILK